MSITRPGPSFDQDPAPAPETSPSSSSPGVTTGDAPPERERPVIGRIVHYVPRTHETLGDSERPAIIVQVWGRITGEAVSLLVFLDGSNDPAYRSGPENSNTYWCPSVPHDTLKAVGTWHWHFE